MVPDGSAALLVDALEKVMPDMRPRALDTSIPITAFAGQTVSFQLALLLGGAEPAERAIRVETSADRAAEVRVSGVERVPCALVAFEGHDHGWLTDAPGDLPDLLRPIGVDGAFTPRTVGWAAVWVDVVAPDDLDGTLTVRIRIRSAGSGRTLAERAVPIEVSPMHLPELDILHTEWIHPDSLAQYYGDEVFDEQHWHAIDRTLAAAAAMQVNTVLTPVWTPPLDTARGHVRRRVQLVDITDTGRGYAFGFDRLQRWLTLSRSHGMRAIEVAHLFTQWGAEASPGIWVRTTRGEEQRFGWHTPATDSEYARLLQALVPALRAQFAAAGYDDDHVLWHISDEPHGPEQLASYLAAKAVVAPLLEGARVIDALSDHDFYATGAVAEPVVATDGAAPFLADGPERLWLYYCVNQNRDVSNRFIGMPSARTRAIGAQLFLLHAAGFLHWGFDFMNTQGSLAAVDPFADTCAGGGLLAGDPFVVYPGEDREPWPSIRFRVLAAAFDDHRRMQLLRDLAGEQPVRRIVEPDGAIGLANPPLDPDRYRRIEAELFAAISAAARAPSRTRPAPAAGSA